MFTSFSFFQSNVVSSQFIMVVKSDNAGTSTSTQFTLTGAAVSSGTTFGVNFSPIADPTDITSVTLNVSNPTITFPVAGTYIVRVDPATFNRIRFQGGGDRLKLLTITQWGTVAWSSMASAFSGCNNMDVTATDYPDLSIATAMDFMFNNCFSLVGTSDFNNWDTSNVNNMSAIFLNNAVFNQDISGWNTANVTNMANMFQSASAFNQDISGWNTANVTSMNSTFLSALVFNQNISGWNVNKVTSFTSMFQGATAFNQNLGSWALKTTTVLPTFVSIFRDSGMSCANYTDTIVGWANYVNTNGAPKSRTMSLQTGRVFANDRSGGAAFADSGAARTYLTGALPDGGWTISGDTVQASC